ncbi:YbhB/YbcL family Raf kinase inhibitor-like protein [Nannocystaceae bacterium ST9]
MELRSESFRSHGPIPGEFAFCVVAEVGHVALAPNRNPHLAWSDAPAGSKSFVVICHDPDVPSVGDDVNQEGRTVPASLPRVDFFHWVLVDIPPDVHEIAAGSHADGVTPHGKRPGPAPQGVQGINDYTGWFAGDDSMKGDYAGYDGPCPPWNDERLHHYHFTVYALDVASLGLAGSFGGALVREAMRGHVLAEASIVGLYSLHPTLAY